VTPASRLKKHRNVNFLTDLWGGRFENQGSPSGVQYAGRRGHGGRG
jgi:hypothetical protein